LLVLCAWEAIDGLIVALYTQQEYLHKKASWTRKLVLITDGANPIEVEDDDLNGVVEKINQYKVDMTIMCVS
jgi:ATP-dependent DNA helicase 2 subunit 2